MGPFPEKEVRKALARAGGRCQCTSRFWACVGRHGYARYGATGLTMGNRGIRWEAHLIKPDPIPKVAPYFIILYNQCRLQRAWV